MCVILTKHTSRMRDDCKSHLSDGTWIVGLGTGRRAEFKSPERRTNLPKIGANKANCLRDINALNVGV